MTQHPFPLAVPAPPPFALRVASDDPDEISSWVARRDGDHSRVVHGSGPYGFRMARIESRAVQLAWATTRLANTLRARFRIPTFHVPLGGSQWYAYGRRRFEAIAGRLVFLPPDTEVTRHSDGAPVMAIDLDPALFEAEVRNRRAGESFEWPKLPRLLQVATPQGGDLIGAIAALANAQRPEAAGTERAHAGSWVIAALAGTMQPPSSGPGMPMSMQRLKRLEEWIDAHLGEPITLGTLCEVAQVGERSLQLTFQARRGMSPMRFVCERRLAEAHRQLFRSELDQGVTAVATSLGFMHLGRFASTYSATFGESPSQTLARGRRYSRSRVDDLFARSDEMGDSRGVTLSRSSS